ncbi:hypothetical protein ASJ81_00470 [Methanosarcina spelaei]|uniref:Uncharacterized protein n=1 Tax=Methanosarcina spelaei TaxID=1036679 RepID=A0A2A2HQT6_9EURY|nr:hypothetical protein ASJ81_00470 [Methanosarcina spelaei]
MAVSNSDHFYNCIKVKFTLKSDIQFFGNSDYILILKDRMLFQLENQNIILRNTINKIVSFLQLDIDDVNLF